MDNAEVLQRRLGMTENLQRISSKTKELVRLCNLRFEAGLGAGEICKYMVCLELACVSLQESFDRAKGVRHSGANEKVYAQTYLKVQNVLGIRPNIDARALCVRFGCFRMVDAVQRALTDYRTRFIAGLPEVKKKNADFSRPVFLGAAFYLAAKKRKVKVDKGKIIQACGSSDAEFANVTTSMYDLCFDTLGVEKRKRAAQEIKANRELLDALPEKRARTTSESDEEETSAGDDIAALPGTSKAKAAQEKQQEYEEWRRRALAPLSKLANEAQPRNTRPSSQPGLKQAKLSFSKPARTVTA